LRIIPSGKTYLIHDEPTLFYEQTRSLQSTQDKVSLYHAVIFLKKRVPDEVCASIIERIL